MSTLFKISGELRGNAILNAVKTIVALEQRPTPESVLAQVVFLRGFAEDPPDQNEINAAMDLLNEQAEQHAAGLEQPADATAVPDDTSTNVPQPKAPTLSRDDALASLNAANAALAAARTAVSVATHKRNDMRAALAIKLQEWVQGYPTMTHRQALQEVIETTRATRHQRANQPQRHIANSYFDRVGAYRNMGTGEDHLRSRMVRGGKRFTRGDVMGRDGRIVRKLPSE